MYSVTERTSTRRAGEKGIKWKFNPPAALHYSGSWKRIVRRCKRVSYTIIENRKLTTEVNEINLCLVKHSLISRPGNFNKCKSRWFWGVGCKQFLLSLNVPSFPFLFYQMQSDHRKQCIRAQSYVNLILSCWLWDLVAALNKRSKWHSDSDVILARDKIFNYGKDKIARSAVAMAQSFHVAYSAGRKARTSFRSFGAEDVRF